jgi:hypothetical protein
MVILIGCVMTQRKHKLGSGGLPVWMQPSGLILPLLFLPLLLLPFSTSSSIISTTLINITITTSLRAHPSALSCS